MSNIRFDTFNYNRMIIIMNDLYEKHDASTLNKLKSEVNSLFGKDITCKEILYTNNTDKLFFGMRVYPVISGNDAMDILSGKDVKINSYYIEIDSRLADPMVGLTGSELVAILLHEIGHVVYDTQGIDAVKTQVDMYFAKADDSLDINSSYEYKELLAYAIKDSIIKTSSLFTKIGNDEMIADTFVAGCGFGPELESGFRKVSRNSFYLNKEVDNRFIVLSWVLRLYKEVNLKRLPAIRTLNKAKTLTGSELEKREISNAVNSLNNLKDVNEAWDIKDRFEKKIAQFKAKGIKGVKNDIYELNLRVRTIETDQDALYVIKLTNADISILEDYITEPNLSEAERQSVYSALEELYSIRNIASKEASIREKYGSMIQVIYPDMK